ncbi:MAG: hypothetical protein V7L00_29525 [Nostoc sp.]|uniref:hypothetical protein n=1 Tax=Nostoc sp. TaxID=1180 RepID=UPI002FFC9CD0
MVNSEQIQSWKTQLQKMQAEDITKLWESTILIELCLYRENYTAAFIQFTQLLERLLYIQSESQNWIAKAWIINKNHDPSLADLMQGWCQFKKFNQDSKWSKLLYEIRQNRNQIIHKSESITLRKIRSIWANNDFPVTFPETPEIIKNLMMNVLMEISTPPNFGQLLMRSLYQWGLNHLKDAI